jgi:energy-coupling factor transporter ATP-binding protein EcfA2
VTDEKRDGYRIVFAAAGSIAATRDPGVIAIHPSSDLWNDFGFRIRAEFVIYPLGETRRQRPPLHISGFLGFIGSDANEIDVGVAIRLLEDGGHTQLRSDKFPEFFTMLPSMGAYREVVDTLGADKAREALLAMHDLVASGDSATTPRWMDAAKDSPIFQNAFLRTSEAYFAWKNAAPVLKGLQFEEVGRLSEELNISFHLAGRPNEHKLSFKLGGQDGLLPKRFAVVIGMNGVGKSQALGRIAEAALKGLDNLTGPKGERPSINRVLAFFPSSATASAFPVDRLKRPNVWYRRFPLVDSGPGRNRQTTPDLVVQLARSEERIAGRKRFHLFQKALEAIDRWEEIALLGRRPHEPIFLSDLLHGDEQELLQRFNSIELKGAVVRVIAGHPYDLSSGERSFVRFTALASLYIENSSLLLLDEPETHLHPNFISQFVAVLDSLLAQTGSAAIIATHSVYFVRETFEDQVIVLRSDESRRIRAEIPRLKTFGADVGTISYFVFGEDEPSLLARNVERTISRTRDSWKAVEEKYKDELSLELLAELRSIIESRDDPREKA